MRRISSAGCVLLLVSCLASHQAFALDTPCLTQILDGKAPAVRNAKLLPKTHLLCFSEILLLYSGTSRGPLWSAEHLTAERVARAAELRRPRSNAFHAELSLGWDERAELYDYRRSGFDRGHMSPNGDMSTPQAQAESFSLANMVPQHPCNNEVLWEGIESAVRSLALAGPDVYVVTGPAYLGETLQSLNGRVLVPSYIYKAIYVPSRHQAGVYFARNDGSQEWEPIPVAELAARIGIDVFPGLPENIASHAMPLPAPTPHGGCRIRVSEADTSKDAGGKP